MIDIAKFNSAIGWVKNYTKIFREYLVKLRVTNRYAQKKKDSVQAVLIQLHSVKQARNYPDYIGLVQYFQSSIGGWDLMCVRLTYGVQHNNLVNNIHSVDCLALRFSDLSFFSQASITHDEKLDFSRSTLELISSSNSSGKRMFFFSDLLFILPVAMNTKSLSRLFVHTPYYKKSLINSVDMYTHFILWWVYTIYSCGCKNNNAPKCWNTFEAFNHNVNRGNTMAMYKSTQTHPKFKWRFFSCQQSKYFSVEATSEQEARSLLPDSPCLFSARIRQGGDHA